jgi:membrane protein
MRLTPLDRARFMWHDVRGFVVRVWEGANEANVPFLASGLSFDALLAAIPFVFLLLSVAGYILSSQAGTAQVDIDEYLQQILPNSRMGAANPFDPVMMLLSRAIQARGTLGLIAVPAFVWFSTRLFGSLRAALNEVFDTRETRSWLMGKVQDIGLVVVTTLLFVINVLLGQGIEILAEHNIVGLDFLPFLAAKILAFASAVVVFVVIFRYAPAHRLRRDTAIFAALICAGGFELAKYLLGIYIRTMMRPNALVSDATIAAVLLFVVWTYYMSFVFLIGGQIAQVYDLRRRMGQQRLLLN